MTENFKKAGFMGAGIVALLPVLFSFWYREFSSAIVIVGIPMVALIDKITNYGFLYSVDTAINYTISILYIATGCGLLFRKKWSLVLGAILFTLALLGIFIIYLAIRN